MPFTKQTHCKNGHELTPENVYVATHTSDGHQYRQCRICHNADSRARYYSRTPEERAARRKSFPSAAKGKHYQRKYKYGLTENEVRERLARQGGCCGICARPLDMDAVDKNDKVAVDHDHGTKGVRGLLCQSCNAGLGMFEDDERRLQLARAYLLFYSEGVA